MLKLVSQVKWSCQVVSLKNEKETQEFWDQFAESYAEIEKESQVPIAQDICAYLIESQLFPTQHFLDLAAGSGRYIAAFLPWVETYRALDISKNMLAIAKSRFCHPKLTFQRESQNRFLQEDSQKYTLLFTAMNPALQSKKQLFALLQKTEKLLILRMTKTQENVFQPYESEEHCTLMADYEKWLTELGIRYIQKEFCYVLSEEIDILFFKEYFSDREPQELESMVHQVFGEKQQVISETHITFKLLII